MDGLAFGIVEPVHGVDGGKHSESPVADGGEEQGDDDPDPQSDAEDLSAVPARTEFGSRNIVNLETSNVKSIINVEDKNVVKKYGFRNLIPEVACRGK